MEDWSKERESQTEYLVNWALVVHTPVNMTNRVNVSQVGMNFLDIDQANDVFEEWIDAWLR